MSRLVRLLALCVLVMAAASACLADSIPSPIFPPNPWEDVNLLDQGIPSPIFPPNPWEDVNFVDQGIPSPIFPPNPWEDVN